MSPLGERTRVDWDEIGKEWVIYVKYGDDGVPIAFCDVREHASLIQDALESFPFELEDYI